MNKALLSSKNMCWCTPQDFFDKLNAEFGFVLDPAATDKTAKCSLYYTPETDGLSQSWDRGGAVFCNPPYGREIGKWVQKAFEEARGGIRLFYLFKSITFDNGSEFMDCAGIEKSVYGKDRKRTKVYYCHPYSAYERGTNENINKMIRRFLPKGTDFRKVTAAYIQRVETWINNYPREILGFETSGSLFERYVAEAA